MPTLKRSKPKTLTDRVRTAGSAAGEVGRAAGHVTRATGGVAVEGVRTARDRAVSLATRSPAHVSNTRNRALAAAGAAGAAAGAVAFWRSRQDEEPSVHFDPAQPEQSTTIPTVTPESRAAQERAEEKAGASKTAAAANGGG